MVDKLVIIGTGLAGYGVAREFRKLNEDTEVILITQDDGSYYYKPGLSTAFSAKKTPESLAIHSAKSMEDSLKVKVLTNRIVKTVDTRSVVLEDGVKIEYSKLVFASGASPRKPNFDISSDKIFQVNNLEDYARFYKYASEKKNITVFGGGLVGCEFANDLLNKKVNVSLVSKSKNLIENLLPEKVSGFLAQKLQHVGATVYTGMEVLSAEDSAKKLIVKLSNNVEIETAALLVAIGLESNIEITKDLGLKTNQGIVVNAYMETNVPDVYAVGDCAEVCGYVLRYVQPMNYCVKALAKTLNGNRTKVDFPVMPVSIKTPAYPIVLVTPPLDVKGTWTVNDVGMHVKALHVDSQEETRGFVLTGDWIKEKLGLVQSMPSIDF